MLLELVICGFYVLHRAYQTAQFKTGRNQVKLLKVAIQFWKNLLPIIQIT